MILIPVIIYVIKADEGDGFLDFKGNQWQLYLVDA